MTLYKYVRPDRIDVITNLELRFTQPGALNDPFELRPQIESLISETQMLAKLGEAAPDISTVVREAYEMLPAAQRTQLSSETAASIINAILSTPEMKAAISARATALIREMAPRLARSFERHLYATLNANLGILSLSEMPDDLLMWAHYADNHHGMVLGFNERDKFFNRRRSESDQLYYLRKVVYSDTVPASFAMDTEPDAFFVSKGTKWAYEREWRMLVPIKDATQSFRTEDGDDVHLYAFLPKRLPMLSSEQKLRAASKNQFEAA